MRGVFFLPSFLLTAASAAVACELPQEQPSLSDTIEDGFAIQVQTPGHTETNNRQLNLWSAGGGDRHLYLSPAGDETDELTLDEGILRLVPAGIHAVINGEYTASDNTTKMFLTERGDPKAFFQPVYGCNPDTDQVQTELAFRARADVEGGFICVRSASGNRWEFRYSGPGNQVIDENRPCYKVTMAVIQSTGEA